MTVIVQAFSWQLPAVGRCDSGEPPRRKASDADVLALLPFRPALTQLALRTRHAVLIKPALVMSLARACRLLSGEAEPSRRMPYSMTPAISTSGVVAPAVEISTTRWDRSGQDEIVVLSYLYRLYQWVTPHLSSHCDTACQAQER